MPAEHSPAPTAPDDAYDGSPTATPNLRQATDAEMPYY